MAADLEAAIARCDLNAVKDLMATTTFEDLNKVYNNASGKKTTLNRVRSKNCRDYEQIGKLLEEYGALSYENSGLLTIRNLAKYQHSKRLVNEGNDRSSVVAEAGNVENMSPLVSPLPYAQHNNIGNGASVSSNVAQAGNVENMSPLVSPLLSGQHNEEDDDGARNLYNPESPQAGNYLVTPPVTPKPSSVSLNSTPQYPRRNGIITYLSESTGVVNKKGGGKKRRKTVRKNRQTKSRRRNRIR